MRSSGSESAWVNTMDKEGVAELINKQVSKHHRAKYLDISYSRYGIEVLSGIRGGASHLGALQRAVRRSGVSTR